MCVGDNYIEVKNKLSSIEKIEISKERKTRKDLSYPEMLLTTVTYPYEFNSDTRYMKLFIYFDADSGEILSIDHGLNYIS